MESLLVSVYDVPACSHVHTVAVLIDWREYKYAHALIDDLLVGTSRLIFDSNGQNCEIAPSMCSKFT